MAELLQRMDAWHWWLISLVLLALALLIRRRWPVWPALSSSLVGYMVLIQPGMFWHRQWLYFLLPAIVLVWLDRRRSTRRD